MIFRRRIQFEIVLDHDGREQLTRRFSLDLGFGLSGFSVTVVPDDKPPTEVSTDSGPIRVTIPFRTRLEDLR